MDDVNNALPNAVAPSRQQGSEIVIGQSDAVESCRARLQQCLWCEFSIGSQTVQVEIQSSMGPYPREHTHAQTHKSDASTGRVIDNIMYGFLLVQKYL